jgi:hypothetical protein
MCCAWSAQLFTFYVLILVLSVDHGGGQGIVELLLFATTHIAPHTNLLAANIVIELS